MIAEHMVAEVEAQQLASDAAAAQVWKGAEDGRLLRIIVRLTSILERPEHSSDPQWAETGHPSAPCRARAAGGRLRAYASGGIVWQSQLCSLPLHEPWYTAGQLHSESKAIVNSVCLSKDVLNAGDLYLLKLYRDFILHQRRDDGSPVLDWGHVVESLNKLDAGIAEKVLLPNYRMSMGLCLSLACIPCSIGIVNPQSLQDENDDLHLVRMQSNRAACPLVHTAESCTMCSDYCISGLAGCR